MFHFIGYIKLISATGPRAHPFLTFNRKDREYGFECDIFDLRASAPHTDESICQYLYLQYKKYPVGNYSCYKASFKYIHCGRDKVYHDIKAFDYITYLGRGAKEGLIIP